MLVLSRTAEVLLIGLAAWLTVGITLAVVMGRRGHNAFGWFLIGPIIRPIALPIAWLRVKDESRAQNREIIRAVPGQGTGPVDVLVGVDGSAEGQAPA